MSYFRYYDAKIKWLRCFKEDDTSDFYLIRKSLKRPIYKEKVRLRSYDIPSKNSNVFLEFKKIIVHLIVYLVMKTTNNFYTNIFIMYFNYLA